MRGRALLAIDASVSQTPHEDDDRHLRELMVRYQAGEAAAFEEFYHRARPLVYRYHRAFTTAGSEASDLTQDTFLQLHRSRRLYDPRLPVRPWLLAIARHVRLMAARAVRRHFAREVPLDDRDPESGAAAAAILHRAIVTQALAALPERYREPIVLHHLLGVSFREIAGIIGTSEGGARIRASRGMGALRRLLKELPPQRDDR